MRYLDRHWRYPSVHPYDRWLERRRQSEQARTIAANIAAIEAQGYRLAHERPLKELGW